MKKTGEFFIPTHPNSFNDVLVNLERYLFALHFCENKIVLDAGCGCGLGTYLFSLVAKRVIAVDHREEALKYAKKYPFERGKVNFIKADLEKDLLPDHEITIALEVIEHLKNPDFFLSQLKGKTLIFSIPLESLAVSKWHKYDFKTLDDIKEVLERHYKIPQYFCQYDTWIYGYGKK